MMHRSCTNTQTDSGSSSSNSSKSHSIHSQVHLMLEEQVQEHRTMKACRDTTSFKGHKNKRLHQIKRNKFIRHPQELQKIYGEEGVVGTSTKISSAASIGSNSRVLRDMELEIAALRRQIQKEKRCARTEQRNQLRSIEYDLCTLRVVQHEQEMQSLRMAISSTQATCSKLDHNIKVLRLSTLSKMKEMSQEFFPHMNEKTKNKLAADDFSDAATNENRTLENEAHEEDSKRFQSTNVRTLSLTSEASREEGVSEIIEKDDKGRRENFCSESLHSQFDT